MIKLKCNECSYEVEIAEEAFLTRPEEYKKCFFCGGQNEIQNIEEVVQTDVERTVKENINKWFKSEGIEGAIELIERNKNSAVYLLYVQELKRRGLWHEQG